MIIICSCLCQAASVVSVPATAGRVPAAGGWTGPRPPLPAPPPLPYSIPAEAPGSERHGAPRAPACPRSGRAAARCCSSAALLLASHTRALDYPRPVDLVIDPQSGERLPGTRRRASPRAPVRAPCLGRLHATRSRSPQAQPLRPSDHHLQVNKASLSSQKSEPAPRVTPSVVRSGMLLNSIGSTRRSICAHLFLSPASDDAPERSLNFFLPFQIFSNYLYVQLSQNGVKHFVGSLGFQNMRKMVNTHYSLPNFFPDQINS